MTFKLRCDDYGFECNYTLEGEKNVELLEQLREHFEEEHGIEYSLEAITQMMMNRGHSLASIKKSKV